MAYINVAEWNSEQVTDWLKGLDNVMYQYIQSFTNNQVNGQQLLNIRPYELEQLGMIKIGHQEIVLEAVEHLRNFHYHLDKENLQFLALRVATSASCLLTQLRHHCVKCEITTQILNDISRTLIYVKPLVMWLDRSPFKGNFQFLETRNNILKFGLEMAIVAQRGPFVENPVEQIRGIAEKLSKLANYIIQDITDPMVLQPAALDLVTLKKRELDLGFYISSSYHGVLSITGTKLNSSAHNSGKIEGGDEIVQINYQTVVGWQYKKVISQLHDSSNDVLLTLKKRPKHTKMYGQIYMKPYRLPSKKRETSNMWGDSSFSQRPEISKIPDSPVRFLEKVPEQVSSDTESNYSDNSFPITPVEFSEDINIYLPKSRAVLQRRNTICGDQCGSLNNIGKLLFWPEEKRYDFKDEKSPSLRDKSISFGFGLELSERLTTNFGNQFCVLSRINDKLGAMKASLPEIVSDELKISAASTPIQVENDFSVFECTEDLIGKENRKVHKMVRFNANNENDRYHADIKNTSKVDDTKSEFKQCADREPNTSILDSREFMLPDIIPSNVQQKTIQISENFGITEAVNTIVINREMDRIRQKKCQSTPENDLEFNKNVDVPPAIEPRKEYLKKTPPAPPPRSKHFGTSGCLKNDNSAVVIEENKYKLTNVVDPMIQEENGQNIIDWVNQHISKDEWIWSPTDNTILTSPTKYIDDTCEALELFTPKKTKSLTLKKKNSLLAKRRKLSIKMLGTSDIQGHLYRRKKNRHGVTYWAKLYFVLIDTTLYVFKTKISTKASCLILLTGLTVSHAIEIHSKSFAFKVYHPSKTFYFAAETNEALIQWMEFIREATIKSNNSTTTINVNQSTKEFYTETESSDDDTILKQCGGIKTEIESISVLSKTKSSTNLTSDIVEKGCVSSNLYQSPSTSKTEKSPYHLKFDSLKKFTKSNLSFGSLNKSGVDCTKKLINDVPVPTEQFRSYRKVPGNAGMQLGTNSIITHDIELGQIVSPKSMMVEQPITPTKPQQQNIDFSSPKQLKSTSPAHNLSISSTNRSEPESRAIPYQENKSEFTSFNYRSPKKSRSSFEHNHIHASNPNLVEFDFQTSKSFDHSLLKMNPTNNWDDNQHNFKECFTLKDFMLQKQAEEAQEMYNHCVHLGVEKKKVKHRKKQNKLDCGGVLKPECSTSENSLKPVVNKIQRRSLPKTPDYAQSFKPGDKNIIMARSKEGLKLRDFGYEFISGDDQGSL